MTTDAPIDTVDGTVDANWSIDESITVVDASGNVISSGADVDGGGAQQQVQQLSAQSAEMVSVTPYAAGPAQKTQPPGGYESTWWSAIKGAASGAVTGMKAVVNQGAKTLAGAVSLGKWDPADLVAVDAVKDIGYDAACIPARIGTEALVSVGTAGLANVGKLGTVVQAIDKAGDIVNGVEGLDSVVTGIGDISQNGLNLQNAVQIAHPPSYFSGGASAGGVFESFAEDPLRSTRLSATEFMQNRWPVGRGPSAKTCPRCASQRLQRTSVRASGSLRSSR